VTDKPDKPDHAREDCYRYWHRPLHIFEGVPNFGFANGVVNVTLAAVAKAVGASQPVEFRKDGIPVDPSPMVGRKRKPEGSRMMKRKTSLILLGAAAGVAFLPKPRLFKLVAVLGYSKPPVPHQELFCDVHHIASATVALISYSSHARGRSPMARHLSVGGRI
jgi:hypothetical protein